MRRRGLPFASSLVSGSKTVRSHSKPCTFDVQPLRLNENLQSDGFLFVTQLLEILSALKMKRGRKIQPSPEIYSITETYS
jgi:hypothetical protein